MRVFLLTVLLAMPPLFALAAVVDADDAERLFMDGDYAAALSAFTALVDEFRETSTDSDDYRIYREALYLTDRLADCTFTQRDWWALKAHMDSLLVLSLSEQNLTQEQLAGALASGIAYATANYLSGRLDESVRMATLFQIKRSLALVLLETNGEGIAGKEAIAIYQRLVASLRSVLDVSEGHYSLNVPVLEKHMAEFEELIGDLDELASAEAIGSLDELWEKYPPGGDNPDK